MLNRTCLALFLCSLCALAYAAAPFYTAWTIREAAKAGDTQYLSHKIDWASIKPGLKASLTRLATTRTPTRASTTAPARPSLWRRIKNYSTRIFIHNFVDRYANPQGFETIVTYGRMYKGDDKTDSDDHLALSTRIANVWSRVKRATFTSLTRFEMDLLDKDDASRLYCGVFELRGMKWMLTDLRIKTRPPAQIAQLSNPIIAN